MGWLRKTTIFVLLCIAVDMGQLTMRENIIYIGKVMRRFSTSIFETQDILGFDPWHSQAKHKLQTVVNKSVPFPCSIKNGRSINKPMSVHRLRPGDIDVIGAIGDSLVAGFGTISYDLISLFREHREVSFIIGGQKTWREYTTIPNIIKEFNPKLVGCSLGPSYSTDYNRSQLNVAISSSISSDMYRMAKELITRIRNDPRVNNVFDWKLISICLGVNDFCALICFYENPYVALEKHRLDLVQTLRLLRDNLPRTFVNLVQPLNVFLLKEFTNVTSFCEVVHKVGCPCVTDDKLKQLQPIVADVMKRWYKVDSHVSKYTEFTTNDFTVEVASAFKKIQIPKMPDGSVDLSAFGADCFHLSQKSHAYLARSIWNDMISCPKRRQIASFPGKIKCPAERFPYFVTKRNIHLCK